MATLTTDLQLNAFLQIRLVKLSAICNITSMARGPSGRIVVFLEPALKRDLHAALAADDSTLKDWVEAQATAYLDQRRQPALPGFAGRLPDSVVARAPETRSAAGGQA